MDGLIAIGDIHGHLEKLVDLMNQVKPTAADQLVFLGDYIDRGPDSKGVIDYLITLQQQHPQTVFLRGNHDQMLLDALHDDHPDQLPADWQTLETISSAYRQDIYGSNNREVWLLNGGRQFLKSYGATDENSCWYLVPQEHIDFLVTTKIWHRQNGFLFVHAGFRENHLPIDQQRFIMLWDRYAPPGTYEIHVVGHQPSLNGQPFFEESRYSLDTGAAYGRPLTACDVLTRQVWQSAPTTADKSRGKTIF